MLELEDCRARLAAIARDASTMCNVFARATRAPDAWLACAAGDDSPLRTLDPVRELRRRLDELGAIPLPLRACAESLSQALRLYELGGEAFARGLQLFRADGFNAAEPDLRRTARLFAEGTTLLTDHRERATSPPSPTSMRSSSHSQDPREIRVPAETSRMIAQAQTLLGLPELAMFAQIDALGADDLPVLRERARRAVIAESEAAAMRRALGIWRTRTVQLLLEHGLSVADVAALVARVEASLTEELPHSAAAHDFDIAAEIDRALKKATPS